MQKHLFILDPLENLNLDLDSSVRLAFELVRLGHKVYGAEPWTLSWDSMKRIPEARSYAIEFASGPASARKGSETTLSLGEFAGIHMRKDPPYDMDYISTTWVLDALPANVKVFNAPLGLRGVNEKLSILWFPEFSAPGLVSADPAELLDYIASQCRGDAMIKPLTLYGGKGIERITLKTDSLSRKDALTRLTGLTSQGKSLRLCQAFDEKIYDGEVRAFTIGGKPLSWCLKKPINGQYMANSNFGSTRHRYTPTADEVRAVSAVATELNEKHGISIIGFDLIGGKISEINVTSPRLLQAPDDTHNYYEDFASWISKECE